VTFARHSKRVIYRNGCEPFDFAQGKLRIPLRTKKSRHCLLRQGYGVPGRPLPHCFAAKEQEHPTLPNYGYARVQECLLHWTLNVGR
jgi:hypothetical protein